MTEKEFSNKFHSTRNIFMGINQMGIFSSCNNCKVDISFMNIKTKHNNIASRDIEKEKPLY